MLVPDVEQEAPRFVWLASFQSDADGRGGRMELGPVAPEMRQLTHPFGQAEAKRRRVRTLGDAELQDQLRRAGCTSTGTNGDADADKKGRLLEGLALIAPGSVWDGCLTPWTDCMRIQRQYFFNARDAYAVKVLAAWRLQHPHELTHVISKARGAEGSVFEVPVQFRPAHMVCKPSSLQALPVSHLTGCPAAAVTPSGDPSMSSSMCLEKACETFGLRLHRGGDSTLEIRVRSQWILD